MLQRLLYARVRNADAKIIVDFASLIHLLHARKNQNREEESGGRWEGWRLRQVESLRGKKGYCQGKREKHKLGAEVSLQDAMKSRKLEHPKVNIAKQISFLEPKVNEELEAKLVEQTTA